MKKLISLSIATLITLGVSSAPVKGALAAKGADTASYTPAPSYTAADYVQDGLVAMWDGIENAGWGVHDPTTKVWTCLVDSRFDLTLKETASVKDNNILLTSGSIPFPSDFTLPNVGLTVEVCHNPHVLSFFLFCAGSHAYETPKIKTVKVGEDYLFANSYYRHNPPYTRNLSSKVSLIPITNTFVGLEITKMFQYNNGVSAADVENPSGWGYGGATKRIGGTYSGELFCIRAYNRALSEAEIKHNYKIDKARFGL